MSEEQTNEIVEEQAAAELDYKALYEQSQVDLSSLAAKKDELLGETKKAKAAKAEAQAKILADAQKNGEFEKLWQGEQERANDLDKKLNGFKTEIRQEKINNNAMKIANELAKGKTEAAQLLSTFVGQSLSELADDMGNLDNAVLDSIKNSFLSDAKYAPLLGGSKATGGGAVGGKPGNQQKSEISRSEFFSLNAQQQSDHISNGGSVVDDL
jgi:hypothetical protein